MLRQGDALVVQFVFFVFKRVQAFFKFFPFKGLLLLAFLQCAILVFGLLMVKACLLFAKLGLLHALVSRLERGLGCLKRGLRLGELHVVVFALTCQCLQGGVYVLLAVPLGRER